MMPVFHSGHFRVFWDALLDAASRIDTAPANDREIIIISPWLSDVTTSRSGWSDASIASAFDIDTGNIESLSDILGKLVERGYDVTVVTLSTIGKWLPKAMNKNLDLERNFMKKISSRGVTCLLRNNLHMKYVKTPFTVFAGSINISFNGLSGRNQEAASLFFADTNSQDFRQRKDAIENTLVGAKDYFSTRIPILTWNPPVFTAPASTGASNRYAGGSISIIYPELGEDYPQMVADGFLPVGRISGNADSPDKLLSVKAQFGTLIISVAMRAMELLVDETVEGFSEEIIINHLYQGNPPNQIDPDAPELLPSIAAIRGLLLSSDSSIEGYIVSRLGLTGNPGVVGIWKENVLKLLDGMEVISAKLSITVPDLKEEDLTLINNLISSFDNGDI